MQRLAIFLMWPLSACGSGGSGGESTGSETESSSADTGEASGVDLPPDVPPDVDCDPFPDEATATREAWRVVHPGDASQMALDIAVLTSGRIVVVGRANPQNPFIALHGGQGELEDSLTEEFEGTLEFVEARPDGGFIAAGRRAGASIVRSYDSSGAFVWEASITQAPLNLGWAGSDEQARGITLAGVDSIFVLGESRLSVGEEDFSARWLGQTWTDGTGADWGIEVEAGVPRDIQGMVGGPFFLGGSSAEGLWIEKRMATGGREWDYSTALDEVSVSSTVVPQVDGGVMYAGQSWDDQDPETFDVFVGRLGPDGEERWLKSVGFCGMDLVEPTAGIGLEDGSFVLVQWHGAAPVDASTVRYILRKFDSDGTELWVEPIVREDSEVLSPRIAVQGGRSYLVGRLAASGGGYFLSATDLE